MTCKYLDCGWCYAPTGVKTNNSQGECIHPECCPYFKSQMTFNSDIEKTEAEIKVLQAKLDLLKEIEAHKSQPKMELQCSGTIDKVEYNGHTYLRIVYDAPTLLGGVWWKQIERHKSPMNIVIDSETRNILEGLWLNRVRKGNTMNEILHMIPQEKLIVIN